MMINNFTKIYKEKRGITTVLRYSYAGYGINANPIYAELESKFSIARGVFQDDKFTRFVDENGNTYMSYIRH